MRPKPSRRPGRPVSADSRHRLLAKELRRRLVAGEWPPGTALPSLRRLAGRSRVGQYTVRMAVEILRREGLVRTGPRRRLLAAGGPDRGPLSGTVIVVVGGSLDKFLGMPCGPELLRGIFLAAGKAGAPLLVLQGDRAGPHPPEQALELDLRGALLVGSLPDAALDSYGRLAIPVVVVDQPAPGRDLHTVTADNGPAAREATARLISAGHRRLAFVRPLQLGKLMRVDPDARERQEGFLAAVRDAGLPRSSWEAFNVLPGDAAGSRSVRAVLEARRPFTALVAASGSLAGRLADAARAAGRSVPGDLSIVCFQGREAGFSEFSGPRINFEEIGRRAFDLLAQPRRPAQNLRVAAEWVDAGTTDNSHR